MLYVVTCLDFATIFFNLLYFVVELMVKIYIVNLIQSHKIYKMMFAVIYYKFIIYSGCRISFCCWILLPFFSFEYIFETC